MASSSLPRGRRDPCGHIQCALTQNIDIALAGFRKLDDPRGDCFVGEVGSAGCSKSRTSHFECNAHETRGLRIKYMAVLRMVGWAWRAPLWQAGARPVSLPPAPDSGAAVGDVET